MPTITMEKESTANALTDMQSHADKATEKKKKSRSNTRNKDLGRRGEEAAVRYLYRRGYDIIERNWQCNMGEADIVAMDGDSVVFVEVKTRTNVEKGFPGEAVGKAKREKYEKIALAYLSNSDLVDVRIRFDVISIVVIDEGRASIRHHINAFAVD